MHQWLLTLKCAGMRGKGGAPARSHQHSCGNIAHCCPCQVLAAVWTCVHVHTQMHGKARTLHRTCTCTQWQALFRYVYSLCAYRQIIIILLRGIGLQPRLFLVCRPCHLQYTQKKKYFHSHVFVKERRLVGTHHSCFDLWEETGVLVKQTGLIVQEASTFMSRATLVSLIVSDSSGAWLSHVVG